ncbi:MAG: FtsW/RodA/SpoVE family cell cycle protein [Ilumatobacteraceae bacterium]
MAGADTTGTDRARDVRSLRERRLETLRRTGAADRHRIALAPPTRTFYWILTIVATFVVLGLVMVLSSSSVVGIQNGGSAWGMFIKQSMWAVLGLFTLWFAYNTPYDTWVKPRWLRIAATVIVGANVAVIGAGVVVNGATAWLDIGPIRLQPSEFMKIVAILFAANLIARRHRSVHIGELVHYPLLGVMGLTALICILQRDFGGALIFMGVLLMMMTMSGMKVKRLLATVGLVGLAGWMMLQFSTRANLRLMAFLNLEETKNDFGYQVWQAILSMANGGWTGTGIGSGTSKWGYVPEAHTDFIFAVIAEEMGLVGTVLVIGGFALLVLFGTQVALGAPDMTGALIAGGVTAWFGFQAFVNIGGVVGAMPLTGLTLPFLSYGGSSLIATMTAAGLLLNVARHVKS